MDAEKLKLKPLSKLMSDYKVKRKYDDWIELLEAAKNDHAALMALNTKLRKLFSDTKFRLKKMEDDYLEMQKDNVPQLVLHRARKSIVYRRKKLEREKELIEVAIPKYIFNCIKGIGENEKPNKT